MSLDLTKIEAGPCDLTFNSVAIGHTQDGVEVHPEEQYRERFVDYYGNTPVDVIHTGTRFTVTATITQHEIANLKYVWPLYGGGTTYVSFGRKPGAKLSTYGHALVISPVQEASTAKDVTLHNAVVISCDAIGFNSENDRVFKVTWLGLIKAANADTDYVGQWASDN